MSTSDIESERRSANREKQLVALSSVLAAVLLTGMKLVVGLTTGSLGILSEAAHSGLDLVAAGVTLFAVRISSRPADREHTYGHGKVENLSALFETLLLLVTCVWIINEAIQRLFFKSVEVEASLWAFAVMVVSIVIDTTRSRALARAAKKYHSQALEADALHFSTDIWSSSVVIGGLLLVRLAGWWQIQWLAGADAAAAIGVAAIVVYVSLQLGGKTVSDLLDAIPPGLRDAVASAVRQVPGVLGVEQVRVRRSGAEAFADVRLGVARDTGLEQAHTIAASAEESVHRLLPGADVTVHVDPVRTGEEAAMTTVRMLAAQHGMGAHSIYLYGLAGQSSPGAQLGVELHLEVSDALRVDEAHQQASAFEKALRRALPGLGQIVTHIEPVSSTDTLAARKASAADRARVAQALREWEPGNGQTCHPHQLVVQRLEGRLVVSLHCEMDGSTNLADAHSLSEQVEQALRNRLPDLDRVVVHIEPSDRESSVVSRQ
jgi:cation diffusion facilitator family transporter